MFNAYSFAICILLFIYSMLVQASPIPAFTKTLTQEDGTIFEAMYWGDEYINGVEAQNGYSIEFDEVDQNWKYAIQDSSGNLVHSTTIYDPDENEPLYEDYSPVPLHLRQSSDAVNEALNSRFYSPSIGDVLLRNIPTTGTGRIVFIPVNFSNTSTTYEPSDFENLLFSTSVGSFRSYYEEVSYNAFTVSGVVTDWITVTDTHSYYQNRLYELLVETTIALDQTFDFSSYDQNGDCYVDTVSLIHQGGDVGTGYRSQRNSLDYYANKGLGAGAYATNDTCPSDASKMMMVNDFLLLPELYKDGSESILATIGVYAHEYGHMFGLPDLYDRDDTDGNSAGIGVWGLMGWGMWNGTSVYDPTHTSLGNGDTPSHMSAWSKYHLGWITPQLLTGTTTSYSVEAASTSPDVYQFLFGSPTPSPTGEYFLIENRQQTGFDSRLPDSGMAIWHIDENMSATNNWHQCYPPADCSLKHYRVSLVQADGHWDLEKSLDFNNLGDTGDLYKNLLSGFSDFTDPSSSLFDGTESGVVIDSIGASGFSMQANLGISPGHVQFSPISYSLVENGGSAGLYVTRVGGDAGSISVNCDFISGSANIGEDFSTTTQTLTWAHGEQTSKVCWVTAINDNYVENDEVIVVGLINPTGGATVGEESEATISLFDDESCSGADVYLNNVAFQAGTAMTCVGTNTITAENTNIEDGADVTFVAPVVYLNDGFVGNPALNIRQQ